MVGRKKGRRNISEDDKKRMQALRDRGWGLKEIACAFNVSAASVRNHTVPLYVSRGYSSREDLYRCIAEYRDEKHLSWNELTKIFPISRRGAMNGYKRYKENERTS